MRSLASYRVVRCAALAAALVVVSCSPEDGGYACSAVGYIPSIKVAGIRTAAPAATGVILTYCLEPEACREGRAEIFDDEAYIALEDLGLAETRPGQEVGVRVQFVDAAGDKGGAGRLYQVPLVETEPNGPGCGSITSGSLDVPS